MDRREFVRMLGAGTVLVSLGALLGAGCAEQEEIVEDDLPPEPPPEPDAAANEGGEEPADAE